MTKHSSWVRLASWLWRSSAFAHASCWLHFRTLGAAAPVGFDTQALRTCRRYDAVFCHCHMLALLTSDSSMCELPSRPAAGQLAKGASSFSVESGLFRAPAHPYVPPYSDFLLLRSPVGVGRQLVGLLTLAECNAGCGGTSLLGWEVELAG